MSIPVYQIKLQNLWTEYFNKRKQSQNKCVIVDTQYFISALIVHYDSLAIKINLLQPQKVWKLFELKNHKTKSLQFKSLQ